MRCVMSCMSLTAHTVGRGGDVVTFPTTNIVCSNPAVSCDVVQGGVVGVNGQVLDVGLVEKAFDVVERRR